MLRCKERGLPSLAGRNERIARIALAEILAIGAGQLPGGRIGTEKNYTSRLLTKAREIAADALERMNEV